MPNGIGGAPGPGWFGHFFTGALGALMALFGTEAWKEMRGELKDGLKKMLNVERQLYTLTLMALDQVAPELAETLRRRRRAVEARPFAENRQVRLITKLLQTYKEEDPEVWEKRLIAMAWLALQDDVEFEGTLNGIENDNAKQAVRALLEAGKWLAQHLEPAARVELRRLNQTLIRRIRKTRQAQAARAAAPPPQRTIWRRLFPFVGLPGIRR